MNTARLAIFAGHPVTADETPVAGQSVRFKTPDGRVMFEVRCGDDGRSIEVSAIEVCKVDGSLFDTCLVISPRVTNVVIVSTHRYGEQA